MAIKICSWFYLKSKFQISELKTCYLAGTHLGNHSKTHAGFVLSFINNYNVVSQILLYNVTHKIEITSNVNLATETLIRNNKENVLVLMACCDFK